MIANEIITSARIILQEPTEDFYTTSEMLEWLNEGQLQFALISNILRKEFLLSSVANQQQYDYPPHLLKSEYISFNGKKITKTDIFTLEQFNSGWETAEAGTPICYFFPTQDKIGLYPKPDVSIVDGIKIYGIAKPIEIIDTAEAPEIPSQYHESLVNYVLYKAKMKDNQSQYAVSYLTLFNNMGRQAKVEGRWQDRRDKKYSFYPAKFQS